MTFVTNNNPNHVIKIALSPSLTHKTSEIVRLLREEPNNPESSKRAIQLLSDAVEENLNFYFVEPAERLGVGNMALKALKVGTGTVVKLVPTVGNKIFKRADAKKMARIASFVEEHLLHTKTNTDADR